MSRAGLPLLVALLSTAGAAHAQPGYPQSPYGQQGGYAEPPPASARGAAAQDAGGYEDDDRPGAGDRAPPPPSGDDRNRYAQGYSDEDQAPPDLGRILGLRSDQQAALQAYQQATTPGEVEQRQAYADQQRLASMTTPQRLDFIAVQMRRDEATFARRADAVRRFYSQLTPDQQRRFDQFTGPDAGASPQASGGSGDAGQAGPMPR